VLMIPPVISPRTSSRELQRCRLPWQLRTSLLGNHVISVPSGPVFIATTGAFLVFSVSNRRALKCTRQVACGAK
jgi:hypothetical protein